MAKIKICGLRRPEDIEAVNVLRPDYCGFIIDFPKSFRSLSRDQIRSLTMGLDPEIPAVGVFVNEPVELVAELLNDGIIAIGQLHGQEDEVYISKLRRLTDKPLIKAFSIKAKEDVEQALECSADYILLDQGAGGSGQVFDWNLVPRIERPWFLAGGLGIENLPQALDQLQPWAVDLSSSLETAPSEGRYKDFEKMRRAIELVRMNGMTEKQS